MVFYLIAIIIFAVAVRYFLGLSNAYLVVGKAIDSNQSKTGFQDSITPPKSTIIAPVLWLISLAILGAVFWRFGLYPGIGAIVAFVVTAVLAGAILVPKPESKHFLKLIFNSLANRYADFQKSGDRIRSQAAREVMSRIEDVYGDELNK